MPLDALSSTNSFAGGRNRITPAFDLLWLDGEDLRPLPLVERKRLLLRAFYVQHIAGRGVAP